MSHDVSRHNEQVERDLHRRNIVRVLLVHRERREKGKEREVCDTRRRRARQERSRKLVVAQLGVVHRLVLVLRRRSARRLVIVVLVVRHEFDAVAFRVISCRAAAMRNGHATDSPLLLRRSRRCLGLRLGLASALCRSRLLSGLGASDLDLRLLEPRTQLLDGIAGRLSQVVRLGSGRGVWEALRCRSFKAPKGVARDGVVERVRLRGASQMEQTCALAI